MSRNNRNAFSILTDTNDNGNNDRRNSNYSRSSSYSNATNNNNRFDYSRSNSYNSRNSSPSSSSSSSSSSSLNTPRENSVSSSHTAPLSLSKPVVHPFAIYTSVKQNGTLSEPIVRDENLLPEDVIEHIQNDKYFECDGTTTYVTVNNVVPKYEVLGKTAGQYSLIISSSSEVLGLVGKILFAINDINSPLYHHNCTNTVVFSVSALQEFNGKFTRKFNIWLNEFTNYAAILPALTQIKQEYDRTIMYGNFIEKLFTFKLFNKDLKLDTLRANNNYVDNRHSYSNSNSNRYQNNFSLNRTQSNLNRTYNRQVYPDSREIVRRSESADLANNKIRKQFKTMIENNRTNIDTIKNASYREIDQVIFEITCDNEKYILSKLAELAVLENKYATNARIASPDITPEELSDDLYKIYLDIFSKAVKCRSDLSLERSENYIESYKLAIIFILIKFPGHFNTNILYFVFDTILKGLEHANNTDGLNVTLLKSRLTLRHNLYKLLEFFYNKYSGTNLDNVDDISEHVNVNVAKKIYFSNSTFSKNSNCYDNSKPREVALMIRDDIATFIDGDENERFPNCSMHVKLIKLFKASKELLRSYIPSDLNSLETKNLVQIEMLENPVASFSSDKLIRGLFTNLVNDLKNMFFSRANSSEPFAKYFDMISKEISYEELKNQKTILHNLLGAIVTLHNTFEFDYMHGEIINIFTYFKTELNAFGNVADNTPAHIQLAYNFILSAFANFTTLTLNQRIVIQNTVESLYESSYKYINRLFYYKNCESCSCSTKRFSDIIESTCSVLFVQNKDRNSKDILSDVETNRADNVMNIINHYTLDLNTEKLALYTYYNSKLGLDTVSKLQRLLMTYHENNF